jgi:hypothetical protein
VDQAAEEEAHSHNEKEVRKDGAQHRRLNHLDLAIFESHNANNQLNGVSESRIHKSTQRFSELQGKLLGSVRKNGSQRNNGQEVDGEDSRRVPVEGTGDDANGHHDEEEVDIVAQKRHLGDMDRVGERSNGKLIAVKARGMLGVEDGAESAAILVRVVVVDRGRCRPAIDQRSALMSAVGGFATHLASDFPSKGMVGYQMVPWLASFRHTYAAADMFGHQSGRMECDDI